jgi:hypothetical protein
MNRQQLEDVLSSYKINISRVRDQGSEIKSLPDMLVVFRKLIVNETPPKQNVFVKEFKTVSGLTSPGVIARVKRTYLSFIREYHLGYLLKEHFNEVLYDVDIDIAGVDYRIKYKDQWFNIHAFVNTENGKYWRKIKESRHDFIGTHVDLPLNLSVGKHVGQFILYDDNSMETLKVMLDGFTSDKKHT